MVRAGHARQQGEDQQERLGQPRATVRHQHDGAENHPHDDLHPQPPRKAAAVHKAHTRQHAEAAHENEQCSQSMHGPDQRTGGAGGLAATVGGMRGHATDGHKQHGNADDVQDFVKVAWKHALLR